MLRAVATIDAGSFVVRGHTALRDDSGRFMEAASLGAHRAAGELLQTLVKLVKGRIAATTRRRTGQLRGSVGYHMLSTTAGVAESDSDHAAPLEEGSVPHHIPHAFGRLEGVFWYGKPDRGGPPGFGFFRDSEKALRGMADEIVRRNMP